MPRRFSNEDILKIIEESGPKPYGAPVELANFPGLLPAVVKTDVFIAGSGPIASAYARTIHELHREAKIYMADIGSQDDPMIGAHHKNSIKYQKDIDSFVNVIKGALQSVSIPPGDTYIPTLGGNSWTPVPPAPEPIPTTQELIFQSSNPDQVPELNLVATAVTRTVGGMGTHWTCACPFPNEEERVNNPIPVEELKTLLERSHKLLNVHENEYDVSIRHRFVRQALLDTLPSSRGVGNLPLAVERRTDNPRFVTWTGSGNVLGKAVTEDKQRFTLSDETRVTRLIRDPRGGSVIGVLVRDLKTDEDRLIIARAYVVACGAIGTPQVLSNSHIHPPALGKYLCEQSLAFCQIVLKREIIDAIEHSTIPDVEQKVKRHHKRYPKDPLPIPFDDPEPQVIIPYTKDFPHHVQVHRDAFSYGDVGPRADSRVVVDLRFFGKQEILDSNKVTFGGIGPMGEWTPGVTDIYGMPQATFNVRRSVKDIERDQKMMDDMTSVASILGGYLPGSEPQFMSPGLALHITGTTRIGNDPNTSVADPFSKVHGINNLWVGGNGCIPDSTACNPTLTSIAIAIRGAESVVHHLRPV